MSKAELDFLLSVGILVSERLGCSGSSEVGPTAADLVIDVDCFPERVMLDEPFFRLSSRNGKQCRQRVLVSAQFRQRIKAASDERMRVLSQKVVVQGNGWGKQFQICTHEDVPRLTKRYWVQICCFPCCSYRDFFQRHSSSKAYVPCKHLLWVFRNLFQLDLETAEVVKQPILSILEVRLLLDSQATI